MTEFNGYASFRAESSDGRGVGGMRSTSAAGRIQRTPASAFNLQAGKTFVHALHSEPALINTN
ncbi:MAG: hypothetical protein OXH56_00580 [Gemmatimonadetes bacterium]|nr:hypothetical protein [Gemmatimonadota bacterium]